MDKLKNKFGKYFEFKNTTNGTNYFLRGLATILFLIPIGIFVGTFIYSFILEGFNPNNGMAQLNESAGTLPNGDYITYLVLTLPYLAWSLYLLFGNSKVKKHIG